MRKVRLCTFLQDKGNLCTALKEPHYWNTTCFWNERSTIRLLPERIGVQLGVNRNPIRRELHALKKALHRKKSYQHNNDWNPLETRVPRGYWRDVKAQRDALEKLGIRLGIKQLDDWYAVDAAAVKKELSFITSYYNNSLSNALKHLYPHHDWDPLKFTHVPQGYWKDSKAQRDALEKLVIQLGIKQLDDWYAVDAATVKKELSFIENYFNGSLSKALKTLYPFYNWDPTKFTRVPHGYWKDINAQRDALEKLGIQLEVKQLDDWYAVDAAAVKKELSFINKYYNGSLYNALKNLYPFHNWDPLKFSSVPRGYWNDINTQRDALEKLGIKLGIKQLDDWYAVDAAAVKKELSFMLSYYNNSLSNALKELYPHHNWDPLKFVHIPRGHWKDTYTQRDALEKLGIHLGIKQLNDWYAVDAATIRSELSFIDKYYNNSLLDALKGLYPYHDWDPLKFKCVPKGYWQQPSTVKHFHELFMKWKKEYNIQRLRDWHQLPPEQLRLYQRASCGIFGTVTKMLREWFPETNWFDEIQGSAPEIELQTMLRLVAGNIIPHHKIGQHSVDVFIPEWNVAIEYQGVQHTKQHWRGDFNSQQQRDKNKADYLLQQGIALVPVSHLWNGTWSQLLSTLRASHTR